MDGDRMFLVGRDAARLEAVADDLRVRGAAQVATAIMDATDDDLHAGVVEQAIAEMDGLDTVLIAHGTMPDQATTERSVDAARAVIETNLFSVVSLLTLVANYMEQQREGLIAVISSVCRRSRAQKQLYVRIIQGRRQCISAGTQEPITDCRRSCSDNQTPALSIHR